MISMIEKGERSPSTKLLVKIAKVFGVSVDELIEKEAG